MVILLAVSQIGSSSSSGGLLWASTDIKCLPDGHQNLAQHIHAKLTIVVDGVPELIPSSIGDTPVCMAEVHTHDASGSIHAESIEDKKFMLKDFFSVWGKNVARDGYALTASVAGAAVDTPDQIEIEDGKDVVFVYTKNEKVLVPEELGVEDQDS